MRISDGSSDVCSSDLATEIEHALVLHIGRIFARVGGVVARVAARGVRTGDDPRTRHKSGDVGLGLVERGDPGLALAEYRDRGVDGIDAALLGDIFERLVLGPGRTRRDRKSTRLNSSH